MSQPTPPPHDIQDLVLVAVMLPSEWLLWVDDARGRLPACPFRYQIRSHAKPCK